ncbi:MAG TPA: glycosyltransferase family 4 protein [Isosphaeraceae bacterium]|nr:glycosyltransferase family 4 protein [Isosphaeraceae bacterium]
MTTVLPLRTGARRMRTLIALSSASSSNGDVHRIVFETCSRLKDRFAFELAIDDHLSRNVAAVVEFGKALDIPVHVGSARTGSNPSDLQNEDLPRLLKTRRWDVVEAHSWAGTGTIGNLRTHVGDLPLAFTPHYPPVRSISRPSRRAESMEGALSKIIRRADVVFCASPLEARTLQRTFAPDRDNCVVSPLGCDFRLFRPGTLHRQPQMVVVCEEGEPLSRLDRVLELYQRLSRMQPSLRLVLAGYAGEDASRRIPDRLKSRVLIQSASTDRDLASLFAQSLALIHLSDKDSSGVSAVQAMACGTPVLLSRTGAMKSLFAGFKGAYFCPSEDAGASAEVGARVLRQSPLTIERTLSDRSKLESEFHWDRIAEARATQLQAAWFRRKYWAISA